MKDQNLTWKVTTEPDTEPITVADVKLYARIDGSSEDMLIAGFITAVRQATEQFLGRALISQTLTASLDAWDTDLIELARAPLQSITEVRTVDEDDNATVYDSSQYYTRTNPEPGQLVLKFESTPPINTDRFHGGYEIEFVAGYGDSEEDVPEPIKLGIMMWVADVYENRVPISEPPAIVKTLMSPYIVINV